MDGLNFGQAIEAMKDGQRVARAGWNGKGMSIRLRLGTVMRSSDAAKQENIDGIPQRYFRPENYSVVPNLPSFVMATASGTQVVGWLASQADMMAEDWSICP